MRVPDPIRSANRARREAQPSAICSAMLAGSSRRGLSVVIITASANVAATTPIFWRFPHPDCRRTQNHPQLARGNFAQCRKHLTQGIIRVRIIDIHCKRLAFHYRLQPAGTGVADAKGFTQSSRVTPNARTIPKAKAALATLWRPIKGMLNSTHPREKETALVPVLQSQ